MKEKTNNDLKVAKELGTLATENIGKFKNVMELQKAYNALEAEFTRRSQRLAELEKRSDIAPENADTTERNVKDEFANTENVSNAAHAENVSNAAHAENVSDNATCSNCVKENASATNAQAIATNPIIDDCQENDEKVCENCDIKSSIVQMDSQQGSEQCALDGQSDSEVCETDVQGTTQQCGAVISESEWKAEVDKFFFENPKAQPFAKEIAQEMLADESLKENLSGLEIAFSRFLVKSYRSPSELSQNDEFLSEFVFSNEAIKSRIIQEYITGLSRQKLPATIKSSGTTTLTPPSRPKTLQEAGWIFVRDNK